MGDLGSVPGSGRSPGEGNGNPLQYCCLENSMDSLAGYSPWGHKESDTTATTPSLSLITTSADMVTVDGPALTPSVTQNPQPTLGFLPGAVCSLGLDQCVMTCIHHYSIRVFPPHEKSSVLFSFSSFSSSNCWHPLIF